MLDFLIYLEFELKIDLGFLINFGSGFLNLRVLFLI